MSLPHIEPYELPCESELPRSRVSWIPDPARAALLMHDMQRYFLAAFPNDAAPMPAIVRNITLIRNRCRALAIPVFYTAQPGDQDPRDRGLQREVWGAGMSWDAAHQPIVDALAPGDGDIVLTKWRYSAFQRTTLEPMLHARGRSQLIVTGVYAHIGCLLSTADAFMRDIEPFFVADAVGDFSRADHDMAVRYAAGRCARVLTTHQLITELGRRSHGEVTA